MTIGPHVRDTGHGRCWADRLRVAEKVGFELVGEGCLYAVEVDVPS